MINPNEPAFPVTENRGMNGLDIRTHMAIQLMSAWITINHNLSDAKLAEMSVASANALIAELNKTVTE